MMGRTEEKIRITAQVIHWLHRLEAEPRMETADRFIEWVRMSPHHLRSFLIQSEIEEALRRAQTPRTDKSKPK